jgi:Cdc6-like AAA superfamily ATPase
MKEKKYIVRQNNNVISEERLNGILKEIEMRTISEKIKQLPKYHRLVLYSIYKTIKSNGYAITGDVFETHKKVFKSFECKAKSFTPFKYCIYNLKKLELIKTILRFGRKNGKRGTTTEITLNVSHDFLKELFLENSTAVSING